MEFSYVFAHVAKEFHAVFRTEFRRVFVENVTCFAPVEFRGGINRDCASAGSPKSILLICPVL